MARSTSTVVNLADKKPRSSRFWQDVLLRMARLPRRNRFGNSRRANPYTPAVALPGVIGVGGKPNIPQMALDAANAVQLAMDDNFQGEGWLGFAASNYFASAYAEGQEWLGYAVLAVMAQRAEYRIMTDTMATEMTREWITLKSKSGDKNKQDKIDDLEERLNELKLQHVVKAASANDGFQGRAQIYIDTGEEDDREEMKKPLDPKSFKLKHGGNKKIIKRLAAIEPMWCYPAQYNAQNPLKPDWYKPDIWWVMGQEVHRTRLLTWVGQPVADMLKPAYSFGGLSLTQMAKPYVDFWLRNRTSESDLLNNFSVFAILTELDATTQDEGDELFARAAAFNSTRDNQGVVMLNKQTEDMKNVAAPLGGVAEIVNQSMERLTLPGQIPIVKFFGNQPAGLNADSEGVIRMFYDGIKAKQESRLREPIQTIVELCMIELWGDVDDDITFDFDDLWQLDEAGKSAIQKTRADQRAVDIEAGVILADEGRQALAKDPDSQYAGLDLDEPLPEPDPMELMGEPGEEGESVGEPGNVAPGLKPNKRDIAPGITSRAANFGGAASGGFTDK